MNIGIIGAGNIGGNLTRRFSGLGHKVFVANSRGPESLAGLAAETGATPVSVHEAARRGDVVLVTIPEKNIPDLPRDLFAGVPDDVVVVDAGGLDDSWRQQPGTPVYAADFDAEGVRRALANASRERKPEWRAKSGGKAAKTD